MINHKIALYIRVMIYFELVILILTFIFILCVLTFSSAFYYKENMRVVPRPNRHAILSEELLEPGAVFQKTPVYKININEEIDGLVAMYFDKDNVPTDYAIQKYLDHCVNRGFVTEDNKMRMKDFCLYLIQFVIPNIPSENDPNPQIMWPYIEFLSNSVTSYTVQAGTAAPYTPFVLYEVTPSDLSGNFWDKRGPGSGPSASSNSSNSNSKKKGGENGGDDGLSGSGCGCPNACFANLLNTMTNGGPGSSPGTNTSDSSSSYFSSDGNSSSKTGGGISVQDSTQFSSSLNSIYMRKKGDLRITNEKMDEAKFQAWKNADPTKNIPANDYVNGFIQNYFGIDKTNPISVGKPLDNKQIPLNSGNIEFKDFINTRSLIDQRHINILIDLVYYFMENIIPGLPTESVPISYVEWRPILWS